MRTLLFIAALALAAPQTSEAGGWFRGGSSSSARGSVYRPPTGVGSNLHRRFVIQRTARRAAQGLPTTRHYGVYVAGGYPGRVWRR